MDFIDELKNDLRDQNINISKMEIKEILEECNIGNPYAFPNIQMIYDFFRKVYSMNRTMILLPSNNDEMFMYSFKNIKSYGNLTLMKVINSKYT